MRLRDLKVKAQKLSAEDLDEIVCDLKASEAAVINNEGREAQVEYILSHGGAEMLIQALKPEPDEFALD